MLSGLSILASFFMPTIVVGAILVFTVLAYEWICKVVEDSQSGHKK